MNDALVLEPAAPERRTYYKLVPLWALYWLTLRQHLHGKRWMVMTVLFLMPAFLAGLMRVTAPNVPSLVLEFLFVFLFIPQALLPLVALLYGSGIIQDEQEEQTFTYLLIRPIPRWAIYGVKVLATLTTTVILTAVFTTLTYAVIYLGADAEVQNVPLRCFKTIGIHALAVVTYCCLFGVMSLLTRWSLVLGFLYAALVEGLLANLPFSIRWLTVIYYARLLAYRTMDFVLRPHGRREDLAAEVWGLDNQTDPTLADHPTVATSLTVLLTASVVCTLLGMYLCSRREFHVKTPEGS